MKTIQSGVMMRFGSTIDPVHAHLDVLPGRTQREVHPARRYESVSYRIESDEQGLHLYDKDGRRWSHYQYRFTYRHDGRTLSVTWRCGELYGEPKPQDGLYAAFQDAEIIAYEEFTRGWAAGLGYEIDEPAEMRRAEIAYRACERTNDRLDHLFGIDREAWYCAVAEV